VLLAIVRRTAPQLTDGRAKVAPAHVERRRQLPQRHVSMPVRAAVEALARHTVLVPLA
jgi:hypothetical protein